MTDEEAACGSCGWPAEAGAEVCGHCGCDVTVTAEIDESTILRPQRLSSTAGPVPPRTAVPPVVADETQRNPPQPAAESLALQIFQPSSPDEPPLSPRRWTSRRGAIAFGTGVAVVVIGVFAAVAERPAAPGFGTTVTAAPGVQTLPGWQRSAAWSHRGVKDAAIAADGHRLIGLSGSNVTVFDAKTGTAAATQSMPGGAVGVVAAMVDGESALVAYSWSRAVVWIGTATSPITIDLTGGRTLLVRGGELFTHASDGSYAIVTPSGSTPVRSPRARTIPLGRAGDAVLWGSNRGTVLVVAVNGAVLSETTLVAPAPGARISGWVFDGSSQDLAGPAATVSIATADAVMVTWTLPDGSTRIVDHATSTGAALVTAPGQTSQLLVTPDGSAVVTATQRLNITTGDATALPAGFVPTQLLGDVIYGANKSGKLQLITPDGAVPVQPAPAVDLVGATSANGLITLTSGTLACFPVSQPSHHSDESTPSTPLNMKEKNK